MNEIFYKTKIQQEKHKIYVLRALNSGRLILNCGKGINKIVHENYKKLSIPDYRNVESVANPREVDPFMEQQCQLSSDQTLNKRYVTLQ